MNASFFKLLPSSLQIVIQEYNKAVNKASEK